MALKKDVVITQNGFAGELIAKNAYWKVMQTMGNKEKIEFSIVAFAEAGGNVLTSKQYSFVPNMDANFIAQSYNFAKKQPEFEGATDC